MGENGTSRAGKRERVRQPLKGRVAIAIPSRSFQVAPALCRQNWIAFSGNPLLLERVSLSSSIAALTIPSSNRAAAVSCLNDDKPKISIKRLQLPAAGGFESLAGRRYPGEHGKPSRIGGDVQIEIEEAVDQQAATTP